MLFYHKGNEVLLSIVTGINLKNVMLEKKCQSLNITDHTKKQKHRGGEHCEGTMTKSAGVGLFYFFEQ